MDIDGGVASQRAKDYFVAIHGVFAVFAFEAENVSHDKGRGVWVVRCSFKPNLNVAIRHSYELEVSAVDGTIVEVRRLERSK